MSRSERKRNLDLDEMPHTVGPEDVAVILGIGPRQARDFIRRGEIPSFRCGKRILISKQILKKLLEDGGATLRTGTPAAA